MRWMQVDSPTKSRHPLSQNWGRQKEKEEVYKRGREMSA